MAVPWRVWFARPEWLWLLLVLPVLGGLALWARWRSRVALARLGGGLAFNAALTRRRRGAWVMSLLLSWGLTLLVIGVAGPQWGRDWTQAVTRGRDLVVVLDLSRSMLAEPTSRLERAQDALLDLCDRVQRRGGDRLGLVVFAGHAKLVCPLTHDYDHFRSTVRSFDADSLDPDLWPEKDAPSGTRIGEGLMLAVKAHSEEATGVQDILLLSDGDDPAGDEEWRRGIKAARERRRQGDDETDEVHPIPVHVVGVGDPEKAYPIPFDNDVLTHDGDKVMTKLEEWPLKEIARGTNGSYIALHTSGYPLGELYLKRIAAGDEYEHGVDALPVYQQRSVWFFVPALVLLASTLFVGEGRRRFA